MDELVFVFPTCNIEDHEPFAADLPQGSTLKRMSPNSPPEALAQWESPQISSSEVSSPSITPANFDFQKPEPSDHVRQILVVLLCVESIP